MFARLRLYRFDWKLTLLTALLLPLLLSLGFWQLRRAEEKLELQEQYAARQREAPVAFEQLSASGDLQYRQVELTGRYDNAHNFLLDNRIHQGQPGYDLITPLVTASGTLVFINRGWLPQGPTRAQLPAIAAIDGTVTVSGSVYVPVGTPLVLGDVTADGWPRVVQTLDPMPMAAAAGYAEAFPYSIRLADGAPGVLVRDWPVISMTPERHQGYAVQWFAMAAMLVGLYLYYSTRPSN
jgi:surfeit locus 1 family protein